jgi:Bacterial PH domain
MRFAPTIFRPAFGRVLSVVTAVICAAGIVGFIVGGDGGGLVRYCWGLLLIAAIAVCALWLPSLGITESEVTVRNVFSTIHVPWPAIERVDTKWALTLHTSIGRVTAWASPAPSRYSSQASNTADARLAGKASGSNIRPGDLLNTDSGAAAWLIRRHWEELREDGVIDSGTDTATVRRDIHWVTVGALAALTAATALGFAL